MLKMVSFLKNFTIGVCGLLNWNKGVHEVELKGGEDGYERSWSECYQIHCVEFSKNYQSMYYFVKKYVKACK